MRHCLRQSSREFHWLGVRGPPIRYSCSGRVAAGREGTSVKGGDNMAATQHHAPGMFVPRVFATHITSQLDAFIRRHFQVGLISEECTLYLSVSQIRRDSQSNCQLVFPPFSIAPTHLRFSAGFRSTFIESAKFLSIWIKTKKQNKHNKL